MPETRLMSVPTTDAAFDDSCLGGWYVCTDLSFSFSQLLHFQRTASLQEGQYSVASISAPQALHSIARLRVCSFLNDYAMLGRDCTGRAVTVSLKPVSMSLHLFLIVTSVTPDRLDTSRWSMLTPSSIDAM